MAKRLSRRQLLGIGAGSLAAGAAWTKEGVAKGQYQPAPVPSKSPGSRPYWEKSYSGGPIDVSPLPPGLPGENYKPVIVPNGGALPVKVVDGVKVFHVIVDEVDHAFDSACARSAGATTAA
jgi:manganese oxidase